MHYINKPKETLSFNVVNIVNASSIVQVNVITNHCARYVKLQIGLHTAAVSSNSLHILPKHLKNVVIIMMMMYCKI